MLVYHICIVVNRIWIVIKIQSQLEKGWKMSIINVALPVLIIMIILLFVSYIITRLTNQKFHALKEFNIMFLLNSVFVLITYIFLMLIIRTSQSRTAEILNQKEIAHEVSKWWIEQKINRKLLKWRRIWWLFYRHYFIKHIDRYINSWIRNTNTNAFRTSYTKK